ncbi:TPA: hypothetical protein SMF53_004642 [Serratia marcescens]|nr:hypothetical protein [Serratia marcescens]
MATPTKKKAEEKYVKDDKKKPGDGTENGAGSTAGDGTENGAGSAAGDGTENGAGSAAGDGTENGAGSAAGDGTENGAGSAAGDGTENGAGSAAGDNTENGAGSAAGDGTDAKPHWFTVQVVRSPSGRRFRAGVEFTSEPKPYDFSLFSTEQLKALAADPYLRIKRIAPAEE